MIKCGICKVNPDVKYKCPICLIRYCSRVCYGKHKSQCVCSVPKKELKPSIEAPEINNSSKISGTHYREVVPLEKLESLREEKPLQDLLKNPHLRNLLIAINKSPNPEEIMQKAMQEPLFTEFADVCLNKLEPRSEV